MRHFSVVGKSAFRVLDAPASGSYSDGRWLSGGGVFFFFCDFHLSHRMKAGVLSLSSKSLQLTLNAHSVLRELHSSETVHT